MMRFTALAIGAIQGFFIVGALALLQAIVQAFAPSWQLPFSIWWGLLFSLPGIALSFVFGRSAIPKE